MIKILGLDPAQQNTGWSIVTIDNGEIDLVSFGTISCPKNLKSTPEILNFYFKEIESICEEHQPNYCSIEDLILAISGVKILVKLARVNTSCINACYKYVGNAVYTYEPSVWKSKSLPKLNSSSYKIETQFEVCKYFELLYEEDIKLFGEKIEYIINQINLTKKMKRKCGSKKSPQYKLFEKEINSYEKELKELSDDIYDITDVSCDTSDSIAIALCLIKDQNLH